MTAKKTDPLIETPIADEMEEPMFFEEAEEVCMICKSKLQVEQSMALLTAALLKTADDYSGLNGDPETFVGIEMIQKDAERSLATLKILVEMREMLLKCDCDGADEEPESGPALIDYTNDNPQEGKASPDGVAYDN